MKISILNIKIINAIAFLRYKAFFYLFTETRKKSRKSCVELQYKSCKAC